MKGIIVSLGVLDNRVGWISDYAWQEDDWKASESMIESSFVGVK